MEEEAWVAMITYHVGGARNASEVLQPFRGVKFRNGPKNGLVGVLIAHVSKASLTYASADMARSTISSLTKLVIPLDYSRSNFLPITFWSYLPQISCPFQRMRRRIASTNGSREFSKFRSESTEDFHNEFQEDYGNILNGRPYTFHNKSFIMRAWKMNFKVQSDCLTMIPLWITLAGLPLGYWSTEALSKIMSVVDRPLYNDGVTTEIQLISYARILDETDVSQPLVEIITLSIPRDYVVDSLAHGRRRNFKKREEYVDTMMMLDESKGYVDARLIQKSGIERHEEFFVVFFCVYFQVVWHVVTRVLVAAIESTSCHVDHQETGVHVRRLHQGNPLRYLWVTVSVYLLVGYGEALLNPQDESIKLKTSYKSELLCTSIDRVSISNHFGPILAHIN
ncbi:hypothetical protein FXO38_08033 [Capsicum annuum]|nr:hypothetical protein FXO38_08033 [Capsicum annuum]KAF3669503.1 hypothetical protein FXO37_08990 [Capsicum annuum]